MVHDSSLTPTMRAPSEFWYVQVAEVGGDLRGRREADTSKSDLVRQELTDDKEMKEGRLHAPIYRVAARRLTGNAGVS